MFDDLDKFLESKEDDSIINISNNRGDKTHVLNLFYSRLKAVGFNLNELGEILEADGNMLILSGAGSGKTTAIILRIIRDLIAGETTREVPLSNNTSVLCADKILVTTFLKSGAKELEQAFTKWCNLLGVVGVSASDIRFSTLHSEYFSLLKDANIPLNVSTDTSKLLKKSATCFGIRPIASYSNSLTQDDMRNLECMIAYARNRLDDKKYEHPLLQEYAMDNVIFRALVDNYKKERENANIVDFDDLQELVYNAINTNEKFADYVKSRYKYIYLDEFQDTSQIQYEILKTYFSSASKVIAIGDDDQTVYSWRGSDNTIIASRLEKDLILKVYTLTTNYRCKNNILSAIIPSIQCNSNRHDKTLKSYAEGGVLQIKNCSKVEDLVQNIKLDVSKGLRVGVISRTNADLLAPAILLEMDKTLDFAVSKSVGMHHKLPVQVFGLMDLITKRYTSKFSSYFKVFLAWKDYAEADCLASVLATNRGKSIYNIPDEDLQMSVPKLYDAILRDLIAVYKTNGKVEAYTFILKILLANVYGGASTYSQKARNLITLILDIMNNSSFVKENTIDELDTLFNEYLPDALAGRISASKKYAIKLTTVHESKGKEWDSVYIWNDIDGVFPASVGGREITQDDLEEERRVHYIAWTRAKEKLTVYTDKRNPSPFLLECMLDNADVNVLADSYVEMSTIKIGKNKVDSEIKL